MYIASSSAALYSPFSVRFTARLLLRVFTALLLAWQIGTTIFLAVTHEYKLNMYTYWSYTILTAFYAALLAALFIEHLVLTWTLIVALPIVLANVVFVAVAILVIVANDAEAYRRRSECDTPPGDLTLEMLRTGDWLIHGGPVFGVLLLMIAGLEFFSQHTLVRQLRRWNAAGHWLYWLYWMVAPIVLVSIYSLIFDVGKLYPTHFTAVQRTLILAAIIVVWQLVAWVVFTQVASADQFHTHAMPSAHSLLAHGRLSEHWHEPVEHPSTVPEVVVGNEVVGYQL
jgi:hypothetical protein